MDENDEGSHSLRLKVTFTDYPLTSNSAYPFAETIFLVSITEATCDCTLITWDEPAQILLSTGLMTSPADTVTFLAQTPNEVSKTASPAVRACYRNGGDICANSLVSTVAIADDATSTLDSAFMTVADVVLTVTPTLSSQIGTYNMRVT